MVFILLHFTRRVWERGLQAQPRSPPMLSLLSTSLAGNFGSCSFGSGAAEGLLLKFLSGVLVFSKFAQHKKLSKWACALGGAGEVTGSFRNTEQVPVHLPVDNFFSCVVC